MNTLDKCWKNCMSMWRWVAGEWKKGRRGVEILKSEWLRRKKHGHIYNGCFFCEYGRDMKENPNEYLGACDNCPGVLVDSNFKCNREAYNYNTDAVKFYNKLRSLNRKRLILIERQKND